MIEKNKKYTIESNDTLFKQSIEGQYFLKKLNKGDEVLSLWESEYDSNYYHVKSGETYGYVRKEILTQKIDLSNLNNLITEPKQTSNQHYIGLPIFLIIAFYIIRKIKKNIATINYPHVLYIIGPFIGAATINYFSNTLNKYELTISIVSTIATCFIIWLFNPTIDLNPKTSVKIKLSANPLLFLVVSILLFYPTKAIFSNHSNGIVGFYIFFTAYAMYKVLHQNLKEYHSKSKRYLKKYQSKIKSSKEGPQPIIYTEEFLDQYFNQAEKIKEEVNKKPSPISQVSIPIRKATPTIKKEEESNKEAIDFILGIDEPESTIFEKEIEEESDNEYNSRLTKAIKFYILDIPRHNRTKDQEDFLTDNSLPYPYLDKGFKEAEQCLCCSNYFVRKKPFEWQESICEKCNEVSELISKPTPAQESINEVKKGDRELNSIRYTSNFKPSPKESILCKKCNEYHPQSMFPPSLKITKKDGRSTAPTCKNCTYNYQKTKSIKTFILKKPQRERTHYQSLFLKNDTLPFPYLDKSYRGGEKCIVCSNIFARKKPFEWQESICEKCYRNKSLDTSPTKINDDIIEVVQEEKLHQLHEPIKDSEDSNIIDSNSSWHQNEDSYDDDYFSFLNKFDVKPSFTEQEEKLLNRINSNTSGFFINDELLEITCREFLQTLTELEDNYIQMKSTLSLQLNTLFELYKKDAKSDSYTSIFGYDFEREPKIEHVESSIYSGIFYLVEKQLRIDYGHARKLTGEPYFPDGTAKKHADKIFNEVKTLLQKPRPLSELSKKTENLLNKKNPNRWKSIIEPIKQKHKTNPTEALQDFEVLYQRNQKNKQIEHICYDVAKITASSSPQTALQFYIRYIYHDQKSSIINNKTLPKNTINLITKKDPNLVNKFNELIEEVKQGVLSKDATTERIETFYQKQRRKIVIDKDRIKETEKNFEKTVNVLNTFLENENIEEPVTSLPVEEKQESTNKNSTYKPSLLPLHIEVIEKIELNDFTIDQDEVGKIALENGKMKNQLIDEINELCYEFLDDEPLIEEDDDQYIIENSYLKEIKN